MKSRSLVIVLPPLLCPIYNSRSVVRCSPPNSLVGYFRGLYHRKCLFSRGAAYYVLACVTLKSCQPQFPLGFPETQIVLVPLSMPVFPTAHSAGICSDNPGAGNGESVYPSFLKDFGSEFPGRTATDPFSRMRKSQAPPETAGMI